MKNAASFCWMGFVCALVLAGCGQQPEPAADQRWERESLAGISRENTPVAKPDLSGAAKDPKYQRAVKDAAALFGARPGSLEGEEGPIAGGHSFAVPHEKAEALLRKAHKDFLARGYYLFRHNQSFGIGGQPDELALLPTTNKFDVMALVEVNGANYNIYTAGVIQWMKKLEEEQPYLLTGIGFDYMEGHFTTSVQDTAGLARRMYAFCPDIVDQGVGTVNKLAGELQKGKLYFWWD